MNKQPEQGKELQLTNTPLQNLRNILSEVDATAQAVPQNGREPAENLQPLQSSAQVVSKDAIKKIVERFAVDSNQFLSPILIGQVLDELRPRSSESCLRASKKVIENTHVVELDQLLRRELLHH